MQHSAGGPCSFLWFAIAVPWWLLMQVIVLFADSVFVHLWKNICLDPLPIFLSFKNILFILWEFPKTLFFFLDSYNSCEYFACMCYVHPVHVCAIPARTGIMDSCQAPCGCWEWNHFSLDCLILLSVTLSLLIFIATTD